MPEDKQLPPSAAEMRTATAATNRKMKPKIIMAPKRPDLLR
jgi:hypothetical protein